ncbi:MAG: hypothetical protein HYY04_04750 [Chloroflexi bacterium]|nr:hypothetical protein [Chloroflexota bacterium]
MRQNSLKARLKAGQPVLGAFINFNSPTAVEVCGIAGLDFIIFDGEHGPLDPETCEHMIRAAEVAGITPIIRVAQNVQQVILRYLDIGAMGVQLPMTNTLADIQAAVQAVKYLPIGRRGLAGVRAADYGLRGSFASYVKQANEEMLLITHVETVEGVRNVKEMLSVPEVDVVFIGPTDLSNSLGYPGQFDHPVVAETIERVKNEIIASGKAAGTIARDGAAAKALIARGFTYLASGVTGLLASAVRQYVATGRSQ